MSATLQNIAGNFSTGGSSTLLDGLLGYWKCDEGTGTVLDSLGVYNGTPTNITNDSSGAINSAIAFNGTSSQVAFGTGIKPTTGLSISFWMKTTSTTNSHIIDQTEYLSDWCGFRIERHSLGITIMFGNNTSGYFDQAFNITVGDGNWHHIVMAWNGSTVYLYNDNSKSSAYSWNNTIVYGSGDILYAGSSGSALYYTGSLDEIAIYNRALTDAEVNSYYIKTPYPFS